jgi:hypothetical protein
MIDNKRFVLYGVLQNMEIFTTANFPFSRGQDCLSFFLKIIERATSQNFQQLKQKYLPLLRQKMHKPDRLLVLKTLLNFGCQLFFFINFG